MAVINFHIAIGRYAKAGAEKKTDFLNCTAFGKAAENNAKFFPQGLCDIRYGFNTDGHLDWL